ncbi:hypothetical protein EOT10_26765 [Streptomyces antnestii]|uniref:Uncharacterized protein n=1 Tax=Streptomyces antnestii TaxID=2494256 RepID=A0A437PF73_9ACTN|nr:hypothetical protein [Streptomyces sp. San01]RVU20936.1 hypothetical protein EOT10_26765 [Streptomyces sp. San01]
MPRRYAYRCELLARSLDGTYEAILATYRATTPRLAARWARQTTGRYAGLLAPTPATPYLSRVPLVRAPAYGPRPDAVLRAWANTPERYEHVLLALAEGRPYAFTVTDYGARYELRVDPLPARRAPQIPAFTGRTRPSTDRGRHRRPRLLRPVP